MPRSEFSKRSEPRPKDRIWSDGSAARLWGSDCVVAGLDATAIGVSDDANLLDGVTRDAGNTVCQNRDRIVVCEVELAEKQWSVVVLNGAYMRRGMTKLPRTDYGRGTCAKEKKNILRNVSVDEDLMRWLRWRQAVAWACGTTSTTWRLEHYRLWNPRIGTSNPESLEAMWSEEIRRTMEFENITLGSCMILSMGNGRSLVRVSGSS